MTSLRIVAALLITAGPAAAEVCEIRGRDAVLTAVTIRPPGVAPFEIDLNHVAVVGHLAGTDVRLEVSGAVELVAHGGPGIWHTVASDAEDGTVHLARGAHLVGVRAKGGALVGRAVLYAADVLPGERVEPDALVDPVRVACAKLTFDWDGGAAAPAPDEDGGDRTYWRTRRGPTLRLFATPSTRATSVTLRAPSCTDAGCVTVEALAQKRAWIQVRARNEGTTVVGWARADQLERIPADVGVGYSYGCDGRHDVVRSDGPRSAPPTPARIARGAMLYAAPGAGPWAKVVVEDGYLVRYAPGDSWARVTTIPGVGLRYAEAWVPVASLLP